MIGRDAWGHVSRTGPRPTKPEQFFDADAPFVETVEQAASTSSAASQVYDGCIRPWDKPITSPYLDRALRRPADL